MSDADDAALFNNAGEAAMFDAPDKGPRKGGRRGDDPFQPTPGEPSGMQSTGVTGNLIGLPFDPATQGVTGVHGETGDPLAREIETGLVAGGAGKVAAAGLGAAAPLIAKGASKVAGLAPKAVKAAGEIAHAVHSPLTFAAGKIAEAARVAGGEAPTLSGAARFAPPQTAAEVAAALDRATSGGGVKMGTAVLNLIKAGTPRATAMAGAAIAGKAETP